VLEGERRRDAEEIARLVDQLYQRVESAPLDVDSYIHP
jgi:hypothetical protein